MGVRFDCACGEELAEVATVSTGELETMVPCEGCGARYAVTITNLGTGFEPGLAD